MGQTNDRATKPSKRKPRGETTPRFDSSRFVNYELDASQQAQCKGWDISVDGIWQEIEDLVDRSHSVTVKYDTFSESYSCFIRGGSGNEDEHKGYILTGRGTTVWKAAKQALFKNQLLGGDWAEYAEKRTAVLDD